MLRLFMRLDLLRSSAWLFLLGDALLGDRRCRPALIAAAACREDRLGERGEGGVGQ